MISKKLFFSRQKTMLTGAVILLLLLLSGSLFFMLHSAASPTSAIKHIATKAPTSSVQAPTADNQQTPQTLFFEDFSGNGKGWYFSDRGGYTRTFANKALILQSTNQQTLVESLPGTKTYDNFTITTTFMLYTGDGNDSVGLYLRGDSNLDHDYRLDIYGDATYSLSKENLADNNLPENIPIIEPGPTSALKGMGQQNTVSVSMQDATITLIINGQVVASVSDSDYTKGQVALFVKNGATSGGVTASFSQIDIESIATPPTPNN
jgi:hypothetical protein